MRRNYCLTKPQEMGRGDCAGWSGNLAVCVGSECFGLKWDLTMVVEQIFVCGMRVQDGVGYDCVCVYAKHVFRMKWYLTMCLWRNLFGTIWLCVCVCMCVRSEYSGWNDKVIMFVCGACAWNSVTIWLCVCTECLGWFDDVIMHLAPMYEALACRCRWRVQVHHTTPLPATCKYLWEADSCCSWVSLNGRPSGTYL